MNDKPPQGPVRTMKAEPVQPKLERTASGIFVPEGTVERAVAGSQAKRRPVMRPTRRQVRAMGNTRVTCKRCQTPVKFKNFANHAVRMHPESDTAKQAKGAPLAHEHFTP